MRKAFWTLGFGLILTGMGAAEDFQGVLADWNCTERMVREGRAQVLKQDRSCSLMDNPARQAYGLITDEQKYYKLDAAGTRRAKALLDKSPSKDNLRVVTKGQLEGNIIKVETMSIL